MTDNPNQGRVPKSEASQEEMRGIHDRIQNYVFRGGVAHCDTKLPFSGEQVDELTGQTLPLIEGAQPTYTLPSLTGAQIRQAGGEAAAAAELLRLGDENEVEFNYSTACIVVDPHDASKEMTPSQVTMTIKREDNEYAHGTHRDIFTIFDESAGEFGSFYEREFDTNPDTSDGAGSAGRVATRDSVQPIQIEIAPIFASALEGRNIQSEGIQAMNAVFDLIEATGQPPEAPAQQ